MSRTKRIGRRWCWWVVVISVAAFCRLTVGSAAAENAKSADEVKDRARDREDAAIVEPVPDPDAWHFSVGGVWMDYTDSHDALQHRSDYDNDSEWDWDKGATSGDGMGIKFTVGKRAEMAAFTYIDSRYDYELNLAKGSHKITTDRVDAELTWSRLMEREDALSEDYMWGWTLGGRYISQSKSVNIWEKGVGAQFEGDIDWKLLTGGYFGDWRPFGWKLKVYGTVNLLFGEVSGLSRTGNDDRVDARFREGYRDDSSLAYGVNAGFGAGIDLFRHVRFTVGYRREWLYSFDATDSGIVVFPDNDDALFIDGHHGMVAYLGTFF